MKKKLLSILLATTMFATLLVGCGGNNDPAPADNTPAAEAPAPAPAADTPAPAPAPADGELEDVHLVVWASELPDIQAMTRKMLEEFVAANADKVNLTFDLGAESESTAKDTILTDITAAADVFAFADDQIYELVRAGALQEVLINTDQIIAANNAGAVAAATVDGKLYAYPMTADNGYFMYYDSSVFTADDVKSMDRMLEVAQAAGKQITMEMHGAWYNYSFFKGAGFQAYLQEDGTNFCNWNAAGGTDVVQAMLDIAANPAFISLGDAEFQTGMTEGTLVAGVNGTWNAPTVQSALGDNYAAAKLPTFTVAGQQVQMGSFAGFKLVGVNAFSQNSGWAMLCAEWLTNYENQVTRFNTGGG
ncbi:MAG: extracellular solute-binding protein, partial [Lachnospiraceae bacterium]|nr:extracellular solute-binding protein [Lachnospiraceae bacterium]